MTSRLHAFEQVLAEHVRTQTTALADSHPTFRRLLDERLVRRLSSHGDDSGLLTEPELRLIEGAAAFTRVREPWMPDVRVYDRWTDSIGEIRRELGECFSESWRAFSADTVDGLLRPGLAFAEGIALVREWLTEVRCYLRALAPVADHTAQVDFGRAELHPDGLIAQLQRIADHFDPPPPDKVGTPYIAERLGCTTVWVTDMARRGRIPKSCIVAGTGNGKPWKFHRARIDEWLKAR